MMAAPIELAQRGTPITTLRMAAPAISWPARMARAPIEVTSAAMLLTAAL